MEKSKCCSPGQNPGPQHLPLNPKQHVKHKLWRHSGHKPYPFLAHASVSGIVEQGQCGFSQNVHTQRRVVFSSSRRVFSKYYVQRPVQVVLYHPMAPYRIAKFFYIRQRRDEVSRIFPHGVFLIYCALCLANRFQPFPLLTPIQPRDVCQKSVFAAFRPPMAFVQRFFGFHFISERESKYILTFLCSSGWLSLSASA